MQDTPERGDFTAFILSGRRFLFSTAALEKQIVRDGLNKSRAFGARYLADAIIRQRLGVARVTGARSNPVSLHSHHLAAALGSRMYPAALAYVTGCGIIATNGRYTVGAAARAYGITKRGWGGGIVPVLMDLGQIERYERARERLRRDNLRERRAEGVPVDYMERHLNELRWDDADIFEHFDQLPEVMSWQDAERIHAHAHSVAALLERDSRTFHRCAAGRLHYAMTNCPKGLRRRVTYGGEALVEIDVSACQPFMAASLYDGICGGRSERARYLADVTGGGFYEQIGEAANFQGSRDDLKKAVLADAFFSSQEQFDASSVSAAFRGIYPILGDDLRRGKDRLRPWQGDTALALRLQSAESQIFIGDVMPTAAAKYRDEPVFPIHDAVMTSAGAAAGMKAVIEEAFDRSFGSVPRLK
jgi:hypothetical protein